ncbi:MAG TPA: tetratricopeptide repeat protein [Candidatus Magasanikbacteria bacterium]|nr:tetratricopeptide repeat protein [Candidatus Magasanikbacteria bacterium]
MVITKLGEKVFDWLAIVSFTAAIVLVPFVFSGALSNSFVLPKQYVFFGCTLLGLLIYAVRFVLTKKLVIRHTVIDLPILIFLVFAFFSAVFSVAGFDSFVGRNEYFVFSFLFLLFDILFFYLGIQLIQKKSVWVMLLDVFGVVSALSALVFLLRVYFGVDIVGALGFQGGTNLLNGAISIFGLWMIVAFVLSCDGFVGRHSSGGRLIWSVIQAILYVIVLAAISFSVIWWLFLLSLFILLVFGVLTLNDCRMSALSVIFGMFVLVLVFVIFGTPLSIQRPVPVEVALGARSSWQVVGDSLFSGPKNFFIGSGLGTFGFDFSSFRPASFNYDPNAWTLRFGQPFSTMNAFVSEGGVFLFLTFIFLVVLVVGHGISLAVRRAEAGGVMGGLRNLVGTGDGLSAYQLFYPLIAWAVLSIAMFFCFFGAELWFVWWFLLAMIISGFYLAGDRAVREMKWEINDTPQYNLSFSFLIIVLICAVAMVGVLGARVFLAEKNYFKAITTTDISKAETEINAAIVKNKFVDVYYATLAKLYLQKAAEAMRQEKPDTKLVADYVAQSVNIAKKATEISPASVSIWENLAIMYENASVLVPSAREWAIKSWQRASELEPTNANIYWHLGLNYANAGENESAEKNFEKSIVLKNDYYPAYASLSALYEKTNRIDEALATYQAVVRSNPNNYEALYNFGRLLYNRNQKGDRTNAEKLWLQSVQVEPNYSNALFSLASYYEINGERGKALQFMRRVYELNKNNPDVEKKLQLLEAGE